MMPADALYINEDGEIQAFQSTAQYVDGVSLPNPYPGDTWEHDAMTGLNLPHITTETRYWVRLDSPAGQIIRRLIAERDEARALAEKYGNLHEFFPWEERAAMPDNLLDQIRDGMRDLAEMNQPTGQDIVMGLLLAIQTLSQSVEGEQAHLACQIHADAQQAWAKAVGEINEKQASAPIDALREALQERDEARTLARKKHQEARFYEDGIEPLPGLTDADLACDEREHPWLLDPDPNVPPVG